MGATIQMQVNKEIEETWASIQPRIYNYVLGLTGSVHEAKDISQETFIRLWKSGDRFADIRNPEAWCMTVAKRLVIDSRRKKGKASSEQDLTTLEKVNIQEISADQKLNQAQLVELVKKTIESLPELQRKTITYRDNRWHDLQRYCKRNGNE